MQKKSRLSREEAKGAKVKAIFTSELRRLFSVVPPSMTALISFATFASFAGLSQFSTASFRLREALI